MKILSVECSATPCSVAIIEDGKILASAFSNVKLTHSQTLMPMVESVLKSALVDIKEIEGFAVSSGPGSFTGVRIGISAVKGMAQAKNIPCVSVSTLEAMAENYSDTDCVVCAVMDARCSQVYNALFTSKKGEISRLCEDRALSIDDLIPEIKKLSKGKLPIYIVGDGAEVFYPHLKGMKNVYIADEHRRFQNAVGVSVLAEKLFNNGEQISPEKLIPKYLRLPQAERELKRKEEQK
ncbi:MAG: tRNA (adenosine(37)-N6)-threonylcarbamoyltransferase complex dimerization subunit type 1 TsaB [Clostridia bacterium]|nr:tRNA (adenosine(37)-N6)-threonylcarbamoyltransferase complex dimerization subunit type 1 TsaB [Clostridia bacterium]